MARTTLASIRLLVVSTDEMDSNDFRRHLNGRHLDSLGYAGRLPILVFAGSDPYIEQCYRAFHNTLHRLRIDISHEHQE